MLYYGRYTLVLHACMRRVHCNSLLTAGGLAVVVAGSAMCTTARTRNGLPHCSNHD
jgi:hypothetical protein